MKLELHATPDEVMRAVEALQAFAREEGLAENVAFGLALALEECGSNIVNHALRRDPARKFQVTIEHTRNEVVLTLRDDGPEFDPATAVARPTDEERHGGWGIQLVRHHMDEVRYSRIGNENVLRLTKRLAPAAGEK